MRIFSIGDRVTHRLYPTAGEGVITNINGNGIEAMWEGIDPTYHKPYKAMGKAEDILLLTQRYTPEQSGDTDDDI
jgi:hypothetical protein